MVPGTSAKQISLVLSLIHTLNTHRVLPPPVLPRIHSLIPSRPPDFPSPSPHQACLYDAPYRNANIPSLSNHPPTFPHTYRPTFFLPTSTTTQPRCPNNATQLLPRHSSAPSNSSTQHPQPPHISASHVTSHLPPRARARATPPVSISSL